MATSQKVIQGITKGLQEYVNPARLAPFKKVVRDQMMELEGLQPFGKGLYHNNEYELLIKYLVESRKAFRNSRSGTERKDIAKNELAEWTKYIEIRSEQLTDDFKMPKNIQGNLEAAWGIVKNRKEATIPSSKMLDFHYELMNQFKFRVPIEPHLLVQMIHPHHGYLSHFPGNFSLEDIKEIYKFKLVASMERSLGQDLLANEISSYAYWKTFDKESQGSFDLKTFAEFMKTFRFTLDGTSNGFKQEFKFALKLYPGELSNDLPEAEQVIRFDFYRYIFLERNL